jgi:hypothetical protein
MPSFLKTLFVNPPSWQGFDGGAGSRYQAKREIRSFWYPTWLAQPAALVPGSRLVDAPPHDLTKDDILRIARDYEAVVIHTSAPTLRGDAALAESLKSQQPGLSIGLVGAHAAVLPEDTLRASEAIDWVGRKAFVRATKADYYTDAIDYTQVKVLEEFDQRPIQRASAHHGDVRVNRQIVGFKKVKFYTLENVGAGNLGLAAFARWLHDPRWAGVPHLLETPMGDDLGGHARDLATLRAL